MSTCPEKELISAAYDDEINNPWKTTFSDHISSCDNCRAAWQEYGKIHALLKTDAEKLEFSDVQMDEGFERLKVRMNYKQVTSEPQNIYMQVFIRRILPAVAAAAVFALVLPSSFMKVSNTQQNQTAALRFSPRQPLPKYQGVISDGTITHAEFASMLGRNNTAEINLSLQEIDFYGLSSRKEIFSDEQFFQNTALKTSPGAINLVNFGSQRIYTFPDVNR